MGNLERILHRVNSDTYIRLEMACILNDRGMLADEDVVEYLDDLSNMSHSELEQEWLRIYNKITTK
jgi:hypothetical protein